VAAWQLPLGWQFCHAMPRELRAARGCSLAQRQRVTYVACLEPRPPRRPVLVHPFGSHVAPPNLRREALRSVGLILAISLLALCGGEVAGAEELLRSSLEVRGGVLAHDVPDLWSGFRLERGIDVNGELLFGAGLPILGGSLRPALGGSLNTEGYTSKAYADVRWEVELPAHFFLGLGLGAALHDGNLAPSEGDRKALGARVLFHIPVELGWRLDARQSLSVYFEHTSNAGTARYNEGLDSIGMRYGYRF
jgi:lipid A 3-O-deacylase